MDVDCTERTGSADKGESGNVSFKHTNCADSADAEENKSINVSFTNTQNENQDAEESKSESESEHPTFNALNATVTQQKKRTIKRRWQCLH
jgi:hypothetical protein